MMFPGQFTSWAFTNRARASGLVPSMGSIGDCYDNAVIESFWGRVQTELLNRQRWRTRIELANALFEYLEIFHNRRRRHSSLGVLTPIEYELQISFGGAPITPLCSCVGGQGRLGGGSWQRTVGMGRRVSRWPRAGACRG
jgi:hypothetical protein